MRNYMMRRILQLIPVLLMITMISFGIIMAAPGGTIAVVGGDNPEMDPAQVEALTRAYGLDQPVPIQYLKWLGQIVRGNFGKSFTENRPVIEMWLERLPNTLYLNLFSLFLIYAIAIPVGVISAVKQYSKFDMSVTFLAFAGDAMPIFVLALLSIFLIALPSKGLIPIGGIASYGVTVEKVGLAALLADRAKYLFLPLLVIVLSGLTGIVRFMRASMLEVIREDYVRTARAKGLAERVVIYKHAMRNALIPIVTISGAIIPGLFSGGVIIEQIFNWPGVGLLGFRAVLQRDYPVIMAFLTLGSFLTVLSYLVVDFLYTVVDPRIKYS